MRYDRLSSIKNVESLKYRLNEEKRLQGIANPIGYRALIPCVLKELFCVSIVYIVFQMCILCLKVYSLFRIVEDMDNAPGMTTLLRDNQLTNMLVLTMFFPCVPSILNTF
jgi:hypothetical protein